MLSVGGIFFVVRFVGFIVGLWYLIWLDVGFNVYVCINKIYKWSRGRMGD